MGLISKYDENDLAKCFERLLNDEKLCNEFGEKGRQLIENKYDWNKVVGQIEKIYENCIVQY